MKFLWYKMVVALIYDCHACLLCFQPLYDLKFEFLSEVCSHEHYIPLCLPIMRKGMIKSFKGEWLDLISVFIQDNKIRTLLNAVWLSEDAMLDFFIFFLIILRTFLFLLNNVMTIKKMFYVGVWINRIKLSYAVFLFTDKL